MCFGFWTSLAETRWSVSWTTAVHTILPVSEDFHWAQFSKCWIQNLMLVASVSPALCWCSLKLSSVYIPFSGRNSQKMLSMCQVLRKKTKIFLSQREHEVRPREGWLGETPVAQPTHLKSTEQRHDAKCIWRSWCVCRGFAEFVTSSCLGF